MIYDENEEGEIIDPRYVNDSLITRYKLVCENDVDIFSLAEEDQSVIHEFIEIGLESNTEREAIQEVMGLLHRYRVGGRDSLPKRNHELLMNRIGVLSGPKGRPYEIVIKEHLVGTSEEDPVIQSWNKCRG